MAAVCSQAFWLRDPLMTKLIPSAARANAQARPIFRPDPVISAVRLVLAIGHFPFSFRPELNLGRLETIASSITLIVMTKKLSRVEAHKPGRPFLARFMDALSPNDGAVMGVLGIVGDVGSTVAGYIGRDHKRDDITGLLVKQA